MQCALGRALPNFVIVDACSAYRIASAPSGAGDRPTTAANDLGTAMPQKNLLGTGTVTPE
jgi:hypothetical protein